jgi:hypothetical protein
LRCQLRQCCLRVLGQRPGCGFFIAPQLVVTCAHVVGRDLEQGTQVELQKWEHDTPLTSKIAAIFPDDDIAFLQTDEPNSAYAPLSAEARSGHELTALGFPKQDQREAFDQFTAIYEGQTLFLDASGRRGVEIKFKSGQVEQGYSGGPLLNLTTGRVMGVVVATRDKRSDLGGWAIEVPVLENLLQRNGLTLPPIDSRWTDAEAQQKESLSPGLIQLTPEQLRQLVQSPDMARVEQLSQNLGKNQNAIRLALRNLGEKEQNISDEALPLKLIESIQAFETQLKTLAALKSVDSEVDAKFTQAREALDTNNPDLADTSFEAAAELALARVRAAEELEAQARALRDRGLIEAASALEQRGRLAMARFACLKAAYYFQQAAELCPPTQAMQAAEYQALQADALYQHGSEQGDNACID